METVRAQLTAIFQQFGLPERMLMDNGSPWGFDLEARHTLLTAWLIRLGIAISHGRPYHPQTQGKDERLNRTLLAEVIKQRTFSTLQESQQIFDDWQQVYNYVRPHEALQLCTPSTQYNSSPRSFPASLLQLRIPLMTYSEKSICLERYISMATPSRSALPSGITRWPCVQRIKMASLMCSFAPKRLPGLAYGLIMNVKETMCYPCLRTPVTHVSGLYTERKMGRKINVPRNKGETINFPLGSVC